MFLELLVSLIKSWKLYCWVSIWTVNLFPTIILVLQLPEIPYPLDIIISGIAKRLFCIDYVLYHYFVLVLWLKAYIGVVQICCFGVLQICYCHIAFLLFIYWVLFHNQKQCSCNCMLFFLALLSETIMLLVKHDKKSE